MEMRIIDDLVDLTLISSGRMSLKTGLVDVHEPLAAAIAVCQPDADAKRLTLTTRFDAVRTQITGDPLPYGIAPNRAVIEELIGHTLKQGIITKPVTVEELFVPSTRGLTG